MIFRWRWMQRLPIDTVQVIQFQVAQGVSGTGSLSLRLPIVNTAWLTNIESGASVWATAIVNGLRTYLPFAMRGLVEKSLWNNNTSSSNVNKDINNENQYLCHH